MPRRRPLYRQLAQTLRRRIRLGSYAPGAFFASEHSLCREFKLSRVTVRKCSDLLIRDGVLHRRPGLGLFLPAQQRNGQEIRIMCPDVPADGLAALAWAVRTAIADCSVEVLVHDQARPTATDAPRRLVCGRNRSAADIHTAQLPARRP